MKKSLLFVALATLTMASCSQDETTGTNNGGGIRFISSVDNTTRANLSTLANLGAFNVTAVGNGANYFTNLGVTTTDNGVTWTPAQTYYWPTYQLAFYAYAPTTLTGVSIDNNAQRIANFTPATAVANQKDVVISHNTGTKTANEGSGVALNFKHALSQIEVKAKCSNTNIKIDVLGVKICHIPSTSTFTYPAAVTNAAYGLSQNQWATPTSPADFMIKGTAALTLTADAQSLMFGDNNFILIPQHLTAWSGSTIPDGAYLSVLCRISSKDGAVYTQLYPPMAGKYGFSAVAINTNWEPGMRYVYTLEYCGPNGGGGGQIDPLPTNPTNPTDPDVDPAPGTGGDKILGNAIKFTVTVDTWKDAASSDIQM